MDYESLLELVKSRRSTHRYKPDPVPDDYVDKIIELALWAPSGANSQPWEFIVVKKNDLRESIVKYFKEQGEIAYKVEQTRAPGQRFPSFIKPPQGTPGFAAAPVFILLCGDPRTKEGSRIKSDNRTNHPETIAPTSECIAQYVQHTHLAHKAGQYILSYC